MRIKLIRTKWLRAAWLGLWSTVMFAQSSEIVGSKMGTQVGNLDHQSNVSACRNGWSGCDRKQLSESESIALAVAEHDHNVSNCRSGLGGCDHSRLTLAEAAEIRSQNAKGT